MAYGDRVLLLLIYTPVFADQLEQRAHRGAVVERETVVVSEEIFPHP